MRVALIAALLIATPGCSWWDHMSFPTPPSADSPEEGSAAFEHHVQIRWNAPDAQLLKSLEVDSPFKTLVVDSPTDDFTIRIHFDVEKSHDSAYTSEFLNQALSNSNLSSSDSTLQIPVPTHPCDEKLDSQGQIQELHGVCLREIVIENPKSHPVTITLHSGSRLQ